MKVIKNQKRKPMKLIKTIFFFGFVSIGCAQNFSAGAPLDKIKANGLHQMALTPEIRSYAKSNLSDMRILDSNKKEVPYVILSEPVTRSLSDFIEYRIIKKEILASKNTTLIIENADKAVMCNISLNISNADIYKLCNVSGSDDMKQWYVITDDTELSSLYDNSRTSVYKSIYFPPVAYRYYKLCVNDKKSDPINITKAGYFKGSVMGGKMLDVKPKNMVMENNTAQKNTQIKIFFDKAQAINRLDFKITEPTFYKRQARILAKRQRTVKKKTIDYYQTLANFELSSDLPAWCDVNDLNEKEFIIEIDNLDSPPLVISQVSFKQLSACLVADLKTNGKYTLMIGNEKLEAPQYDLNYFTDKIPQQLPVVSLGSLEIFVKTPAVIAPSGASFWQQKWFMWLCLGVGALVLFYFSSTLLKEMQSKK